MSDDALSRSVEIKNRLGLHARPAALLVQTVTQFDADVTIRIQGQSVNGKSILGLMMLGAGPGTVLEVSACGRQAAEALAAVAALVESGFNEE